MMLSSASCLKQKPLQVQAFLYFMKKENYCLMNQLQILFLKFKKPVVLDKFNDQDSTYTTVPAKREITFRDLLTHTSGLDYADIGSSKVQAIYAKNHIPSGLGYFDASLLERMKALGKLPLSFQPGEKWQYGLNSDLLGCLIEVISGMNLEDFLRKRIFFNRLV